MKPLTRSEIIELVKKNGTPKRVEIFDNFRYKMTTESEKSVAVAFKLAAQQAEK